MIEKQTSENTKLLSIRLPVDLYGKIEHTADQSERTISQQIRFMLQKYLEITETIK